VVASTSERVGGGSGLYRQRAAAGRTPEALNEAEDQAATWSVGSSLAEGAGRVIWRSGVGAGAGEGGS
jgi:hypothetical protein